MARGMSRERALLVSGKMGAGKDTMAGPLANALWPGFRVVRMAYADALRDEVDEIINVIRQDSNKMDKIYRLCVDLHCDAPAASRAIEILDDAVDETPDLNAHMHTPALREVMQYWGTQVRRAEDPDYWVRKTEERVRKTLDTDDKTVVVITDGRFPNEADLIRRLNGVIVRLDVDPETQIKRIRERDGVTPDSGRLSHVSETALDDYSEFDVRVDASKLGPLEVIFACMAGLVDQVDDSSTSKEEWRKISGVTGSDDPKKYDMMVRRI